MKMLSWLVALSATTLSVPARAAQGNCINPDRGAWAWGEAPTGCDANRFGDPSRIRFVYGDYVIDRRSVSGNDEQRRNYMSSMNALLREVSTQTIRAKVSGVQEDEVAAFVRAVKGVATQETYWSHYRIGPDGRYKLMTGDRFISHGMMQINQRYHAARGQDNSFDLVGNVTYGVEHYLDEWTRAKSASCVTRIQSNRRSTRAQYLEALTRAAYSAYNGGSGAICRWANPNHAWAKNDKGFHGKWQRNEWSGLVADSSAPLKLDLNCIRSGDELCAIATERRGEYLTSRPLILEEGSTCVTRDGQSLHCASDLRTFACLARLDADVLRARPLRVAANDRQVRSLRQNRISDRAQFCAQAVPGLSRIGDVIRAEKDVRVRRELGGADVGFIRKGQRYQVLDFEVDLAKDGDRYYRVRMANSVEGWAYAGNSENAATWFAVESTGFQAPPATTPIALPIQGGRVRVKKTEGLRLLAEIVQGTEAQIAAAGTSAPIVARGSVLQVEKVEVRGTANEIWLKVATANQQQGWIYAGRTYPQLSIVSRIEVVR
jgi:hypothetical protein